MTDLMPPHLAQTPRRWIAGSILLLAMLATGFAIYLTVVAVSGSSVGGCSGSSAFGCDEVLTTKWSKWFGIPVALFAAVNYLGVAIAAGMMWTDSAQRQRMGLLMLIPTATLATAAAFWFTGLQVLQVQKLCPWCLATHACGLAIGILTIGLVLLGLRGMMTANARQERIELVWPSPLMTLSAVLVATIGFLALLAGQVGQQEKMQVFDLDNMTAVAGPPSETPSDTSGKTSDPLAEERTQVMKPVAPSPETSEPLAQAVKPTPEPAEEDADASPPEATETNAEDKADESTIVDSGIKAASTPPALKPPGVTVLPNRPPVPRSDLMWLGDPNAKHVIVECVSYTCPSCREAHPLIKTLTEKYGDDLAIAVFPIGMEKNCNYVIQRDHAKNRGSCKLTRLAIAVWTLNPKAFPEFHNWLMTSEDFRNYNRAWQMACSLVPESELIDVVGLPEVRSRLQDHNQYLERFDSIPALIIGSKMIKGKAVANEKMLTDFVNSQLGDAT